MSRALQFVTEGEHVTLGELLKLVKDAVQLGLEEDAVVKVELVQGLQRRGRVELIEIVEP